MGEPHEIENKKYLAELIADAMAKVILKVNIYGYDLWYPYNIEVKEPTPYVEWPYEVCEEFEIDILTDMGSEAREIVIETDEGGVSYTIAWDPGRPYEDAWYPKTIPAGAKFTIENKKIAKLYFHALTPGHIYIEAEGFTDC